MKPSFQLQPLVWLDMKTQPAFIQPQEWMHITDKFSSICQTECENLNQLMLFAVIYAAIENKKPLQLRKFVSKLRSYLPYDSGVKLEKNRLVKYLELISIRIVQGDQVNPNEELSSLFCSKTSRTVLDDLAIYIQPSIQKEFSTCFTITDYRKKLPVSQEIRSTSVDFRVHLVISSSIYFSMGRLKKVNQIKLTQPIAQSIMIEQRPPSSISVVKRSDQIIRKTQVPLSEVASSSLQYLSSSITNNESLNGKKPIIIPLSNNYRVQVESSQPPPLRSLIIDSGYNKVCHFCKANTDVFCVPRCSHKVCWKCVQKINIDSAPVMNCFVSPCNSQIETAELDQFFYQLQMNATKGQMRTFSISCAYCFKQINFQSEKKPEYSKCSFCSKVSCFLHSQSSVKLEECFCKCPICHSDAKKSSDNFIQCPRGCAAKCKTCSTIVKPPLTVCTCQCSDCGFSKIGDTQKKCQCDEYQTCQNCLAILDDDSIKFYQAETKKLLCNPCFYEKQLNIIKFNEQFCTPK